MLPFKVPTAVFFMVHGHVSSDGYLFLLFENKSICWYFGLGFFKRPQVCSLKSHLRDELRPKNPPSNVTKDLISLS